MKIQYLAWLSSEGERRHKNEKGVLWAGMVRNLPEQYKHLLDAKDTRQYAIVWDLDHVQ